MRQSTSADYTLRLLNGVALELARISVKEAARGRNSIYQTHPAMGESNIGIHAPALPNVTIRTVPDIFHCGRLAPANFTERAKPASPAG